jgi:hypothetical protein
MAASVRWPKAVVQDESLLSGALKAQSPWFVRAR